ncbi:hypothetical protein [Emticicia sp.]|uniref:hypothetical protein n=1 Tax=Emticicia sp. TaxID=1930953 RepID=UPI0037513444
MEAIRIPITRNNFEFLNVFHPQDFKCINNDDLGMILTCIYKVHAVYNVRDNSVIKRAEYPCDLKIIVRNNIFAQTNKITFTGIRAVNNRIDKLIKKELYIYVRKGLEIDPKPTIRSLIDSFCEKYSLTMSSKDIVALERNERRKREKNGELLYKRNVKSCQSKKED